MSQYVISPLKKKGHWNVDVMIWGFNFVKCIMCEWLKDLISKLKNNSDGVKEHEMKLQKHNIHYEMCKCFYHTWRLKSIQSKYIYIFVDHP
jgi:hypothetical protein